MQQSRYRGHGVLACATFMLGAASPETVLAQSAGSGSQASAPGVVEHPLAGAPPTQGGGSDESLTVMGHRSRFQPAPVPGAPLGPPPDKPSPHLGRYKISGDQTKKDGYDTQTGAYIAPFGNAYTNAGPVSDGLASRFQH